MKLVIAESTGATCQNSQWAETENWPAVGRLSSESALPDWASPTSVPFFMPQSRPDPVRCAMCVHVSPRSPHFPRKPASSLPATHSSQVDLALPCVATFSSPSTVSHRPSPTLHQNTTTSPNHQTIEPGISSVLEASIIDCEKCLGQSAGFSPRYPGIHHQLP